MYQKTDIDKHGDLGIVCRMPIQCVQDDAYTK